MVAQGDQAVDVQQRARLRGQDAGDLIVVAMDGDGICIEQVCADRVGSVERQRTGIGQRIRRREGCAGKAEVGDRNGWCLEPGHAAVEVDDPIAGPGAAGVGERAATTDRHGHARCDGYRPAGGAHTGGIERQRLISRERALVVQHGL